VCQNNINCFNQGLKIEDKIKMLDGYKFGMSTVRESFKSTELKRCIATEMRWNNLRTLPDISRLRINSAAQFQQAVQR